MWFSLSLLLSFSGVLISAGVTRNSKNYQAYKAEARIVGGDITERNEFPWMATLADKWLLYQGCGATLINKRFILTAGHCIQDPYNTTKILRILFGLYNSTWLEDPAVIVSPIRRIIPYPEYTPVFVHDFTLIELAQDVEISDKVRPICLPPTDQDFTGEIATILGWGRISQGGKHSQLLRKAELQVVDQEYCREIFKPLQILDDMLCAFAEGKDACQRDSGGPLMWKDKSDVWHLIGVVSWGKGCAIPPYPGVYARVTSVLPWIRSIIGEPYC